MSDFDQKVSAAQQAWKEYCRKLEQTGIDALADLLEPSELELAEGLRYLTRISALTLDVEMENCDTHKPHASRNVGPTKKMGGDNPQGHYLKIPVNATDIFRITGNRGNAGWLSLQMMFSEEGFAEGLNTVFGDHIFGTELETDEAGNFSIMVGPDVSGKNTIRTEKFSVSIAVRQFFDTREGVTPMELSVENLSRADTPKQPLSLHNATQRLEASGDMFKQVVPRFKGLLRSFKEEAGYNSMPHTDWRKFGGVPGGQPVNGVWKLADDEALIINFKPPEETYYWDVQVGNTWFETFDYRHFICGLTHRSSVINDDGSVTLVVSEKDPGTANWLQTAGHTEGHMAIRFQLIKDAPPQPDFEVVKHDQLAEKIAHLPTVTLTERREQLNILAAEVDDRYRL